MRGSIALRGGIALRCGGSLFRCRTVCCGCALRCGCAVFGCRTVCGGGALFRCSPVCSGCPLCGGRSLCSSRALCRSGALRGSQPLMADEDRVRAAQEALYCEQVLAKGGDNVLRATLRDAAPTAWTHYPPGDVFDPASGGQWYYHCHVPPEANEHGHFHCFVRPAGKDGPVHHLVAVGVDAHGRLLRLFTVNQWVVGDTWLDAEPSIALLERFDMQMPQPSYLTNRWLTAVLRLYADDIANLIRQRDAVLAKHRPADGTAAREDRGLEVASELRVDLLATASGLGL